VADNGWDRGDHRGEYLGIRQLDSLAHYQTELSTNVNRFSDRILKSASPPDWSRLAADDLATTLADHAHCEKKASASAIALINDYPEDEELVRTMARLAAEEIEHFAEVHALLKERGGTLVRDRGDPYAQRLLGLMRRPGGERKLDRLLVAALIEARSCERFRLLREELVRRGEEALALVFRRLESSEAGHAALFVELAVARFGKELALTRLDELASAEAEIVAALPVEARIH
jgi:tRNA-(ms[2]io[6]A)-hydroxylase